jgi:hypothetical protein
MCLIQSCFRGERGPSYLCHFSSQIMDIPNNQLSTIPYASFITIDYEHSITRHMQCSNHIKIDSNLSKYWHERKSEEESESFRTWASQGGKSLCSCSDALDDAGAVVVVDVAGYSLSSSPPAAVEDTSGWFCRTESTCCSRRYIWLILQNWRWNWRWSCSQQWCRCRLPLVLQLTWSAKLQSSR